MQYQMYSSNLLVPLIQLTQTPKLTTQHGTRNILTEKKRRENKWDHKYQHKRDQKTPKIDKDADHTVRAQLLSLDTKPKEVIEIAKTTVINRMVLNCSTALGRGGTADFRPVLTNNTTGV